MTVSILLFSSARERVGRSRLELAAPKPGGRISDLLRAPELAALAGRSDGVRYALNEEFASAEAPVADGDVVAILPPASGG
jgi:molybdopterin converting factor small subunit